MFWVSKVVVPAVLVAGMTAGAIGLAQPPGEEPNDKKGPTPEKKGLPGDDKRGPRFGDRKDDGPPSERRGRGPERTDPAVEAWVKVLVEKMNDPHDTIRDSARAGIVAVGPPALPTLRKLAEGDDGAKATAARKLIAQVERDGPDGPGMPGRPGGPGFGPGGPGGPRRFGPGGPGGPPEAPGGPMPPGRPGVGPGEPGGRPMPPGAAPEGRPPTRPGARPPVPPPPPGGPDE